MNTVERIKPGAAEALPVPWRAPTGPLHPADIAALSRQRIEARLIRELEEMIVFAMASGIGVPADIGAVLDRAFPDGGGNSPADWSALSPSNAATPPVSEPGADAANGGQDAAAPPLPSAYLSLLAAAHREFTKLIAPAKPGTLVLLMDDRRSRRFLNSFGAVPMARTMLVIAVLSVVVLLGSALSHQVNAENLAKGLLSLDGYPLLANEIFLAAAACVGASLANLKLLDRYISNCTYSQRYDGSYWTRLVMGMISGVVLSQLIFSALVAGNIVPASGTDSNAIFATLGQPVLALLGGFSAELVHDVLTHFIAAVGYLFGTDAKRRAAAPSAEPGASTGAPNT